MKWFPSAMAVNAMVLTWILCRIVAEVRAYELWWHDVIVPHSFSADAGRVTLVKLTDHLIPSG